MTVVHTFIHSFICAFIQGCTRQAALERQDLPCTYLAHNELKNVFLLSLLLFVHAFMHYEFSPTGQL